MLNQITPEVVFNGQFMVDTPDNHFVEPPVYEVIRVMEGIPLFFEDHMARLFQSFDLVGYEPPFDAKAIYTHIKWMIDHTGIQNNNIRLEVGKDSKGIIQSVLFWVKSIYPPSLDYERGVETVTAMEERPNPHAKVFRSDYAARISKRREETGAFEVILVKHDGIVTEGSRSNLFFIKDRKLYSASSEDVLMGITRQHLIKMIKSLGIELIEEDINFHALDSFEACFITGTSIHLLPVKCIDQRNYPSAQHPLFIKLKEAFEGIVINDISNTRRQHQND